MKRKTSHRYHLAVREAQKNTNKISSDKMANSISNNCSRNMFSETHKIHFPRGRGPMCVDNETEDTVIENYLKCMVAAFVVPLYSFCMDHWSDMYVLYGIKHYKKYGMPHHKPIIRQ